jgi:hypothetical protein
MKTARESDAQIVTADQCRVVLVSERLEPTDKRAVHVAARRGEIVNEARGRQARAYDEDAVVTR